jgi:hypothetical protein
LRPIAKGLSENKRSLSLAMTTLSVLASKAKPSDLGCASVLSLDCFAVARNDAVSGSGARFLPRFVIFQGLAARKISARFRRGRIRRTRFRPARPEIPGARDGRRQRASRQSEVRSGSNRRPRLYDRIGDEITLEEVERIVI